MEHDILSPPPRADAEPGSATPHVPYFRATLILCIGTFTLLPAVYAVQPILPLLSHDFAIDAGTAGLTLAVFNLALAAALLVAGPLSDRVGRRPLIVLASLLLVLPTLLAAWTPTYGLLLVARVVQGVLASGIGSIAIAYIGDELPTRQRGEAIGWYSMSLSWSALVGRVGGGVLSDAFGWRNMFLALAVLSLIGALALVFGLPRARRFSPSENTRLAFRHMAESLRSRALVSGYLVGFLLGMVLLGFLTYVSYYLSAPPFNLSTAALGLIFLSYVFGMLAPYAGKLSTRIGRRPVIALCLALMSVGMLTTLATTLPVVIIGIILVALSIISGFSVTNAYVGDHAAGRRGGATALYLCGWYGGGAAGAALLGPVWGAFGWYGVTLCSLGLAALALAVLRVMGGSSPAHHPQAPAL